MKAGVVVVTKFCSPKNEKFSAYINYLNRSEAVRRKHAQAYNLYHDYMGNPEKTTGIFTKEKDYLEAEEKKVLKQVFEKAQENGSLMWQTVISFDNRWLKEQGVYSEEGKLDDKKMREVTRNAIAKMLKKENLEEAVWSAAIHYNTDNIHIHIATVEEIPTRERRDYIQYQTKVKDGKKEKVPVLDRKGDPVVREEYKGRFKLQSIEACKSGIVNQLIEEKGYNKRINALIRDTMVQSKKEQQLAMDVDLQTQFFQLYQEMPTAVARSCWNYHNPIMEPLREPIDELSRAYLEKYHKEEMKELKELLELQDVEYQKAYGGSYQGFMEGKMEDLYTRLGNAVLQEIRHFDMERRGVGGRRGEKRFSNFEGKSGGGWNHFYQMMRLGYELEKTMRRLEASMDESYETWKNIQEYDRDLDRNLEK